MSVGSLAAALVELQAENTRLAAQLKFAELKIGALEKELNERGLGMYKLLMEQAAASYQAGRLSRDEEVEMLLALLPQASGGS